MDTLSVSFVFKEKASRQELLVRLVYWIPMAIVYGFWSMANLVALVLNFFGILLFGKRIETLARWSAKAVKYLALFEAYMYLVTDERPPLWPEPSPFGVQSVQQ